MKFGVREITDVVFKAVQDTKIGGRVFHAGEPVLLIDTAKTSTIEEAATTVYATGGKGNARLIAWEGEKTLTFTVEDALLSEVGFALLSGAGLFPNLGSESKPVMIHKTKVFYTDNNGIVNIKDTVSTKAPVFVMSLKYGSLTAKLLIDGTFKVTNKVGTPCANEQIFIDYYIEEKEAKVTEIQIDAEKFAGYYYVEGNTKFRREADGKDLKATLTFPKVKIQSNFSFAMSSTGDPSTFTFTMDAMPGYTMFESTKKVLLAMQIIDEVVDTAARKAVTTLDGDSVDADIIKNDSLLDETSEEYFTFVEVNENGLTSAEQNAEEQGGETNG